MSLDPSTPLRGLPVACIDFESTGFAGPDTHVVEVAVVHATLGGADARVAFSSRVRPPVPIPAGASAVHRIYDADVTSAPTFAEIVAPLSAALAGRVVVAYNAPADYTFAAVELARLGLPPIAWPWLDLLVVRKATKTRGRPGKLVEVAEEYGIVLDAHGAAGDALAAALLLRPLMRAAWTVGAFASAAGARAGSWREEDEDERSPARVETWGAFTAWQREAALYQERDFASYRRRQGDARPPQSAWHVLEGVESPTWDPPVRAAACPDCGERITLAIAHDGTVTRKALDGQPHVCDLDF